MPKLKSGYLTAPVLLILAVITAGVAGIILFNAKLLNQAKAPQVTLSPTPFASVQSDPTAYTDEGSADWKTYTNNFFSLKYPEDYTFSTHSYPCCVSSITLENPNGNITFEVLETPWERLLNEGEEYDDTKNYARDLLNDYPSEKIKLDGRNANMIDNIEKTVGDFKDGRTKIIVASKDNIGYRITLYKGENNEGRNIFDQILSTFKFTN